MKVGIGLVGALVFLLFAYQTRDGAHDRSEDPTRYEPRLLVTQTLGGISNLEPSPLSSTPASVSRANSDSTQDFANDAAKEFALKCQLPSELQDLYKEKEWGNLARELHGRAQEDPTGWADMMLYQMLDLCSSAPRAEQELQAQLLNLEGTDRISTPDHESVMRMRERIFTYMENCLSVPAKLINDRVEYFKIAAEKGDLKAQL